MNQVRLPTPRCGYDAKGLMIQAIRDDNPVMFMYHKGIMGLPWMAYLSGSSNAVPEDSYTIPFGQANVMKEGSDITIVSISQMAQKSMLAANELAEQGIHAEVIDLRTLVPLTVFLIWAIRELTAETHLWLFAMPRACLI
jgi:pyruvate dehydrogenase E1 component beta subunit